jgi:hypothetical protein
VLVKILGGIDVSECPDQGIIADVELDVHSVASGSGASEMISPHFTVDVPGVSIGTIFQGHCARDVRPFLEKNESHGVMEQIAVDVVIHCAEPLSLHVNRLQGSSSTAASRQPNNRNHKQHAQTLHPSPFHPF